MASRVAAGACVAGSGAPSDAGACGAAAGLPDGAWEDARFCSIDWACPGFWSGAGSAAASPSFGLSRRGSGSSATATSAVAASDSRAWFVTPGIVQIFSELEPVISDIVSTTETVPYRSFDDVYEVPRHAFVGDCFIFRDIDHFSQCGEDLISKEPSFVDFVRDL